MAETQLAEIIEASSEVDGKGDQRSDKPARVASGRVIRSVLLFTVAGVVLYGAAAVFSDYETVTAALKRFPLGTLAVVMVIVVLGWVIRGWRFHYYLRETGSPVPFLYSICVFLAGFALTGTPGKMGEAVKAVFLKDDYGISATRVVGILLVERLMDLFGVLLLGSFSILLFSRSQGAFLLCAVLVVAGGVFLCLESVYRPILQWTGRISLFSWVSEKALGILLSGKELMTVRIFVVGLLMSTVAWGLESFSLYLILEGLDLPSTLLQANFVYCFSTIVGALSMLPGGIGGMEAGMVGLLAAMGISYSGGLPAVILIRVCTLWFAIVVGVGFMFGMLARRFPTN